MKIEINLRDKWHLICESYCDSLHDFESDLIEYKYKKVYDFDLEKDVYFSTKDVLYFYGVEDEK